MRTQQAAHLFTVLVAVAALFHLLLAAGLPWGSYAWGGAYPGALPGPMRLASAASAMLLAAMGFIVLVRAGLVRAHLRERFRKPAWGVVGYFAVGVVANAITPSAVERMVWLPVAAALLATSFVVARQPSGHQGTGAPPRSPGAP